MSEGGQHHLLGTDPHPPVGLALRKQGGEGGVGGEKGEVGWEVG